MAYSPNNLNALQQQLQDLTRQYQQLQNGQPIVYQQPMPAPPQQIPVPVQARQVQYVEGLQGARLYQENMQPNSSEIIMDKEQNVFYHVSKDANGTPSKKIMIGRFELEEPVEEEPAFLTRKDFDEFKEEIRQLFIENTQPKSVTLSSQKKVQGDKV